ncbi:MAG TPA: SDR family NAD(P)-dependent oxidoreductase, partial [Roseiflexaceae bacterium]
MRLEGKVAIVAGAGWGGTGAAIAYRFAQEGARLVINSNRLSEKRKQAAEHIRATGSEVATVMGDVAESDTWEALAASRRLPAVRCSWHRPPRRPDRNRTGVRNEDRLLHLGHANRS